MTLLPHKSTSPCVLSSVCRKTYGFSSSSLLFSENILRLVISSTLLSVWSRLIIQAILLEVTGVVSSFSKNNTVSPGIGTSDGRRSWLVDHKREHRTPPTSKGHRSG